MKQIREKSSDIQYEKMDKIGTKTNFPHICHNTVDKNTRTTREYLEAGQSPQSTQEIRVEKTPEVLRRIYRAYDSTHPNSLVLSPSALNAYLDCRLRFYYRYVAGLKTPDEVSAEIDSALFGTIFHLSAQLAYTDLTATGKTIQKEDLERLLRNDVKLQSYVDQAFKKELFKVSPEEKPEYNAIRL